MKYIVVYTAKRKNAKRHVYSRYGKPVYFDSIEEAKKNALFGNERYKAQVMTANYKDAE